MKIDGRTKSGKMIKQDLKTLGLVGKILRVWWLFSLSACIIYDYR